MKQHTKYALKLFLERLFFNFLTIIMIPVFIPIIDHFSAGGNFYGAGSFIFSGMVCSLYLGISFDMIWKLGRHDRQPYATEKHYPLKGLSVALLSEIPYFVFFLFVAAFPHAMRLRAWYRILAIGAYMGFVPADHFTIGYGLVLLIMPAVALLAYMVGYRKPKEEKDKLSHKIMYKNPDKK